MKFVYVVNKDIKDMTELRRQPENIKAVIYINLNDIESTKSQYRMKWVIYSFCVRWPLGRLMHMRS